MSASARLKSVINIFQIIAFAIQMNKAIGIIEAAYGLCMVTDYDSFNMRAIIIVELRLLFKPHSMSLINTE